MYSIIDNHGLSEQFNTHTFSLVKNTVDQISSTDVDLIIEGETGAGKDTLAHCIHKLSPRNGKFVSVNCAAIPESLAESELFGVKSGAYTGAHESRSGHVEAANNGTLYLDEIDSLPLTVQAKLLGVLESRGVKRLGSTDFIPVNMRIIASTKTPLETLVEQGKFRRDLYYRLNVIKIKLPELRNMPDMILPLFMHFVADSNKRYKKTFLEPDEIIKESLLAHDWPGNIRELKFSADRFVLGVNPIDNSGTPTKDFSLSLKERLKRLEKILIESSLNRNHGELDKVVEELSIEKRTLYNRMKALNVEYSK